MSPFVLEFLELYPQMHAEGVRRRPRTWTCGRQQQHGDTQTHAATRTLDLRKRRRVRIHDAAFESALEPLAVALLPFTIHNPDVMARESVYHDRIIR